MVGGLGRVTSPESWRKEKSACSDLGRNPKKSDGRQTATKQEPLQSVCKTWGKGRSSQAAHWFYFLDLLIRVPPTIRGNLVCTPPIHGRRSCSEQGGAVDCVLGSQPQGPHGQRSHHSVGHLSRLACRAPPTIWDNLVCTPLTHG